MSLLGLILIFVLHFEAVISGEPIYLYNRPGHDVILPCASASPSDTTCSIVTWLYSRDQSQSFIEVLEGKVKKSSARAARMSLNTSCSLVINNITAEDAGLYTCRQGTSLYHDANVYLSVLTISPSPPDADPKRDGEVTLECSLWRWDGLGPCEQNSVRWVDETGTVLLDEGVGFLRQTNCVSVLKVKRQSGHNRRYTCQFVDENNVKIEADYTPVFTGGTGDDQPEKPHSVIRGEPIYLYNRPGHDVILPCASASPSDTTCSIVTWLYSRDQSQNFTEVQEGKVKKSSARAARMSLDTSCSLVINNITAEDAGLYTCRQGRSLHHDTDVYLSVLTISPSPPDADPKRDGEVTLECSLSRYTEVSPCQLNSVRWVNETGTVLLDEGVGYKFIRQTNCVSVLKVKRQSGHNRTYTCQFVDENNVKIEADYTPVFTDQLNNQTYIIIGAVVAVVVVLVVIAAVLIKYRKRVKVTADVQKPTQHPHFSTADKLIVHDEEEPESNLTYATVSHADQQTSPKKKVKEEEEVTYSTVKTSFKTEADNDPSSLYSYVSQPK